MFCVKKAMALLLGQICKIAHFVAKTCSVASIHALQEDNVCMLEGLGPLSGVTESSYDIKFSCTETVIKGQIYRTWVLLFLRQFVCIL